MRPGGSEGGADLCAACSLGARAAIVGHGDGQPRRAAQRASLRRGGGAQRLRPEAFPSHREEGRALSDFAAHSLAHELREAAAGFGAQSLLEAVPLLREEVLNHASVEALCVPRRVEALAGVLWLGGVWASDFHVLDVLPVG